jgi:hypothetical protein
MPVLSRRNYRALRARVRERSNRLCRRGFQKSLQRCKSMAGTNSERERLTEGPAIILVHPQLGENIGGSPVATDRRSALSSLLLR